MFRNTKQPDFMMRMTKTIHLDHLFENVPKEAERKLTAFIYVFSPEVPVILPHSLRLEGGCGSKRGEKDETR